MMASRLSMGARALASEASQLSRATASLRATQAARCVSTETPRRGDRRFVRISGAASYVSGEDMKLFMKRNGVELPENPDTTTRSTCYDTPMPLLLQGSSDVFQNYSIWVYDAGSQDEAKEVSTKLAGKMVGMKLVRAAAVDIRLISDMVSPNSRNRKRTTLRKRLHIIAPKIEERGRTLLCTNLEMNMSPRVLWGFFGSFDVLDIRMLRRSGVASVIFRTEEEALRAIRERSNVSIQNRGRVTLKMFE